MAVDIGAEAINRGNSYPALNTIINRATPATSNGTITSIDAWTSTDITDLRVGTFYVLSGNTLKCRDSESIPGAVPAGSKVNKAVSIVVQIGDYIGAWTSSGKIESDTAGFMDMWTLGGAHLNPGSEAAYTLRVGWAISLGGYIDEAVPLPSKTFQSIWHVGELVNDTVNYKWDVRKLVSDTINYKWHVQTLVSKTSQLKWRVFKLVDKSLQTIWNVVCRYLVSNTLELQWYNLLRILKIYSELSRDLTIKSTRKN